MGQLLFGRNMILLINDNTEWELIYQQKQAQMNKYDIHKNLKRFDQDYKVIDKTTLNNSSALKNETPYKGPFIIKQCWTNDTVKLQCGTNKTRPNIRPNNTYTYDTNVEYITPENMCDDVNI